MRALTARVELSTDATLPEAGAEFRVTTDGKIHTARVELPSGEPGSNLSWELVRTKYQGLTRHVFPEPVAETVADLTGCHSARILIRSLRAAIPADPQENS